MPSALLLVLFILLILRTLLILLLILRGLIVLLVLSFVLRGLQILLIIVLHFQLRFSVDQAKA